MENINKKPCTYEGSLEDWIKKLTIFIFIYPKEWKGILSEYEAIHSKQKEMKCDCLDFYRDDEGYLRKTGEKMYLKLTNESEVRLLRQINCLLGKNKFPNGVLGAARKIIEKEKFTVHDCVVIFMNPVKNDTISIYDELRIYPYTGETDEEYSMDIRVQRGTEVEWSGYMIRIKETGGRIYLIYPMRKQDVKKKNSL